MPGTLSCTDTWDKYTEIYIYQVVLCGFESPKSNTSRETGCRIFCFRALLLPRNKIGSYIILAKLRQPTTRIGAERLMLEVI